jgi:hypothetical protein
MRTSFRIMAAGAATAIGFLAFTVTPAMASAPTPLCLEYTTYVACGAAPGGASPWTWTVEALYDGTHGTPDVYTTTVPSTKIYCAHGTSYSVTSSYVAGGVTHTSGAAIVQCNGSGNE